MPERTTTVSHENMPLCYGESYGDIDGDNQTTLDFLTRSDSLVISERLAQIGVSQNSMARIRQLNSVLEDMSSRNLHEKNIQPHVENCKSVKVKLDGFISDMGNVMNANLTLKADRAAAKKVKKQWKNRANKAQDAYNKSLEKGRERRASEYAKLRDIAVGSRDKFKQVESSLEADIATLADIEHAYKMIRLRLMTMIAEASAFVLSQSGTSLDTKALTSELDKVSQSLSRIEALSSKSLLELSPA